jgi:hypothetical protein
MPRIALVCPEMRDDRFMVGDLAAGYLSGLPPARAKELERVNGPGLAALERYLVSGQAVAFLGAGVSAPLYPLWDGLIGQLVGAASARLDEQEAVTLRVLARRRPEAAVEIVRQQLGDARYLDVLREGAAGADRSGDWAVVDGCAGTGVPVCVQGRGDH